MTGTKHGVRFFNGQPKNDAANRTAIMAGKEFGDGGNEAGPEGRAYQEYLLGDEKDGVIIRLFFPGVLKRGSVVVAAWSGTREFQSAIDWQNGNL